ncbi:site-2 protease family protein [Paenibacillus silviterrae]|uniref:site-2 protease family protein n=1 Tax=Paenibacillus silviterrae TaxID=3242194 RepID=UPI0025439211|nr:site-2 protease family protein [Paenibacillus chinjuensis]
MDWNSFLAYPLEHLPFVFLVLMLSFSVHEFAHAYLADRFGDPTPRSMGRVTLNPRVHLDVLGMIFFLLVGIGWAKPVLVNRSRFKNPRGMGIAVSFAGPFSNLVLAFISLLIYAMIFEFHWIDQSSKGIVDAVKLFFEYLIRLNIFLFILNLLPFPPLDGYRILEDVLPRSLALRMKQYEQWFFYIILLLFFIPPLRAVTLGPIFGLESDILRAFSTVLSLIF